MTSQPRLTFQQGVQRAIAIYESQSDINGGNLAVVLLTALAIHGVTSRNKSQTLQEHFLATSEAYKTAFKMIQATGIEDDLKQFDAKGAKQ